MYIRSHGSLPGRDTQTLIPEESFPLVILPILDRCSFPLNSTIWHGNTWNPLGDLYILFLTFSVDQQSNFPMVVRVHHLNHHSNSLLRLLTQKCKEPKVARWPSELQFSGIAVLSLCRSITPFGIKCSRLAVQKVEETAKILVVGYQG